MFTTQKQIRSAFKELAIEAGIDIRKHPKGGYKCTARCAFVDYVDRLHRSGMISDKLAFRATL